MPSCSVWGDIQYKDKNYALPILLKHLDKVVLHVDDKSPKDHYNSYATEWKGKDLHITVSIASTTILSSPASLTRNAATSSGK